MKKVLGIVVLGLLLSGNAYAGVNEPGSGPIASITDVKSEYYENKELPNFSLTYRAIVK
jgi:hypothetical protein